MQIPDDTARELVEEYIRSPKEVEKRMRTNPPILQREAPPAGRKLARSAGAAKLLRATTPKPLKPPASANGNANGSGHAPAAVAAQARARKPAPKVAQKPAQKLGKSSRRAPARAR